MNIEIIRESEAKKVAFEDLQVGYWYEDHDGDIWFINRKLKSPGYAVTVFTTVTVLNDNFFREDNYSYLTPVEVDITLKIRNK